MFHGLSLAGYLELLEWTRHNLRVGASGTISEPIPYGLNHFQIAPSTWITNVSGMLAKRKIRGCHFGTNDSLANAAKAMDRKFVKNIIPREVELPESETENKS